jgi:hypothetical protein
MPTTLELSNASGNFTNPIVLKRSTGELGLAFALQRTDGAGVILPANLPAGTQYVIRLNNPTNGISTTSTPFTVIAAPRVSISASSTATCASQPVQLTAGGADTYTWSTRQTSNPISVTTTGAYSVTGIATNGCSGTATVSIINRPLPTRYPIVGSGLYCEGGNGRLIRLAGSQTDVDYQLLLNNNPIGNPVPGTGSAISFGNQTASGTYTALATYSGSSCQQIMTGGAVIGIAPTPSAPSLVTASGFAYPAGVTALTINQNVGPVSLTATGCSGGMITANGDAASSLTVTTAMTGTQTYTATCTQNGCTSPAASFQLTVVPNAPVIATQSGQSVVNADLNSGPVTLLISGCEGTVNWMGPNNTAGTTSSIVVSTEQVGTFVYTATCSVNGYTSSTATAIVTVGGRLTVLHRDVDNYADNNAIQPLIQIQNQGAGALPLSRLTLRYYLTVENGGTLGNLSVNYAQLGNQNVQLRYVPLNPAQAGASGYVEYSFTAGAGSLAAGANSGSIQGYFTKSDYGSLFEPNDYSYNPVRDQLTGNLRITAYYDGVLISGLEPGSTAQVRAVRALTESRNGPSATQINTVLEVRNEGNVAINYSDLRARYYFTADGNERLLVEVDEGNVSTQLVKLGTPVNGADTYLEIRYNQGGQLAPGASTGAIRYRISKPDGGRFNQTNDYSYQEQPQDRSQNSRVVVYVGSERIWGQEPGGSARLAFSEASSALSVKVLGNPIQNDQVSFEVTGAEGQALQLQLLTPQGRVVNHQLVPSAEATQRHQLSVAGQAGSLFLLQVSTLTQTQTVKVIKAQ